jgi:nucleotide-binding universal stress UspA family protein
MKKAMFKTILVAADDSETASRAVRTAVELVKALGGNLHVMTAYRPEAVKTEKLPDEYLDRVTDPADLLLDRLRNEISNEGVEAKYHPVADHVGADLIVVGNRGMKGVRRVLGSVPNSVAHSANCSVLIVDTVSEN